MIKNILRTTFLTFVICCSALITRAQIGFDFSHYEIGFAAGFNQVYGDAQTQTTTPSFHLNLTYDPTPYVNIVFEAQMGRLAGGDSLKTSTGRQFTTDLTALILRGQLQMGEIVDYSHSPFNNAIKNLYVSAGLGFVVSHITSINRYSIKPVAGLYTPGVLNSQGPFIPLRLGYEFKVFNKYQQPAFKIDLGYEYNIVLSDNLDGLTSGSHFDIYSQFIIGVKFAFGGDIVSYRKQIPY
ncbi:hypothetical protein [Mucilaginibacter gotjawali]|uniref:Uncharacterized protein n=2 Tax=Mucilaginibacter gotjawali TaxID=1550579 RepID=A0A839SHT4_9SPHI|nr:hypothetical protein [Mucilaginibacter gotjawali]MBB3057406.1 hypothetical protein [Mucilaginibacter gotjawali]BAU55476.1 hypothetical protein MgSA37_03665 [Mucilaginibacter gotjawali]